MESEWHDKDNLTLSRWAGPSQLVKRVVWNDSLDNILNLLSENRVGNRPLVYNRWENITQRIKLGPLDRLTLWLTGRTKVEEKTYPGWSGKLPFYAYTATIQGKKVLLFDYEHGHEGRLDCSIPDNPKIDATDYL